MRDRGFVPRLLLARDLRENDEVPLSPAQTHYLRRVLRLREGDAARVFDGEGAEREAIIVADKRAWNLKIGTAATSADARFPRRRRPNRGRRRARRLGDRKNVRSRRRRFRAAVSAKAAARSRARALAAHRRRRLRAMRSRQTHAHRAPANIRRMDCPRRRRFGSEIFADAGSRNAAFNRGAQNDCNERNAAGIRFGDAVARRRRRLFAGKKNKARAKTDSSSPRWAGVFCVSKPRPQSPPRCCSRKSKPDAKRHWRKTAKAPFSRFFLPRAIRRENRRLPPATMSGGGIRHRPAPSAPRRKRRNTRKRKE